MARGNNVGLPILNDVRVENPCDQQCDDRDRGSEQPAPARPETSGERSTQRRALRDPQRRRFELGIQQPDVIERAPVTAVGIEPDLERRGVVGRERTSGPFRQPESGLVALPFCWFFAQNVSSGSLSIRGMAARDGAHGYIRNG